MSNLNKDDIEKTLATEDIKRSFSKKLLLFAALVVIGVVFYLFYIDKNNDKTAYNTVLAQTKDLKLTVSATGNLKPTNSVDVGIEVSGTILEIYVDYNDIVKKGQILAKLDTNKLESHVNSAKASLNVAKANLQSSKITIEDTKRELERVGNLQKATKGSYPSVKEVDAANVAYEKSKASHEAFIAQKEQAEASLESSQEELRKAVVISPINGIVLSKAVEVGQSVVASMQIPVLFTLAEDLKKMEVIVSVDEADVGQVKEQQSVDFTVDAYPEKVFKGIIKQVRMNSQILNNVVTYDTVVSVDNSELLLRPGMTVSADITTKIVKDALLVPTAALRFSPPKKEVEESSGFRLFGRHTPKEKSDLTPSKKLWILKDGIAVSRDVEVGESEGIYSVIESKNISLDDKIIVGILER